MDKKQEFINYVTKLIENQNEEMPEGAKLYWESLLSKEQNEKPMFTENGKMILKYIKDHPEISIWKAKDIAEGLFISSRSVSGGLRKLVTDGFVEKLGQNPSTYVITEKGKEIEI